VYTTSDAAAESFGSGVLRPSVLPQVKLEFLARPDADLIRPADWWDNPTMVVTLDAKRRLTVPATLAPAKPGVASADARAGLPR
jgi:hypothetical protein